MAKRKRPAKKRQTLNMRLPRHVALAKAGLPQKLADFLDTALDSPGWMVAVWRCDDKPRIGGPFTLMRQTDEFPVDYFLRAQAELEKQLHTEARELSAG